MRLGVCVCVGGWGMGVAVCVNKRGPVFYSTSLTFPNKEVIKIIIY